MSWNSHQVRAIAKVIISADFEHGRCLKYLTGRMREAIVEARVFAIVRAQEAEAVRVADMDQLLADVRTELVRQLKLTLELLFAVSP